MECGKSFSCESCGETFKTRNALYKHARRKGHTLPEGSKPKGKKVTSSPKPLPPPPIIIKHVVRLPKTVSSSTQTEQAELTNTVSQSNGGSATETSNAPAFMDTTLLDLSTQTEEELQEFDISDLATQTDFTQTENDSTTGHSFYFSDFATQTNFTQTDPDQSFNFSDLATQTDLEPNSNAEHPFYFSDLVTHTRLSATGEQSFDFLGTQTDFTQTEPVEGGLTDGEHSFELSVLATQTDCTQTEASREHFFSINDLATQTSFTQTEPGAGEHSFNPSDLTMQTDVTSFLNFGTQTPERTASQSSQTSSALHTANQSCQTGRQLTVEASSGHQVDPSTFPRYEECLLVEFGTQTSHEALLGIATQTSQTDFYADFERADFGTQTIDELFSNYMPPSVDMAVGDQGHTPPEHLDFSAQADLPFDRIAEGSGHVFDHVTEESGLVTEVFDHVTEGSNHMTESNRLP